MLASNQPLQPLKKPEDEMSSRQARNEIDSESDFALWRIKRAFPSPDHDNGSRRVLIAHKDRSVSESLAVQLRLKGLQVIHSPDLRAVRALLTNWQPQALLLDTGLDNEPDYVFLRTLHNDADLTGRLLVAMSNVWPADPVSSLKEAGFDAHCRRPNSTWRIVEMVEAFFTAPLTR
jgi:CheY-like chemotaxis protein